MKTLIVASLILSSSAFANITCKGAVAYAIKDATALNTELEANPGMSTEALTARQQSLVYRLGDVRMGCARVFDAREELCGTFNDLTMDRFVLLESTERSVEDTMALVQQNFEVMNRALDLCDQE